MSTKPAWKIYALVIGAMLPTLFAWIFSLTVLFPKVELLWELFGPAAEGRKVSTALQYIISFSRFVFGNATLLFGTVVLAVVVVEVWWKSWPRWRATILVSFTVFLNAVIMLSLLAMTSLALLLSARAQVMSGEVP